MQQRSLTAPFKFVWQHDPALDTSHPDYDYAKFIETGDMAHLPVKPGELFAVFHCKPLSARAYAVVNDRIRQGGEWGGMLDACRAGVKGWDNLRVGGQLVQPKFHDGMLTEASLDDLGGELATDIGAAVVRASKLNPMSGQVLR